MGPADQARFAIGILGNIVAVVLYLSPIPTFLRIWRHRDVEEFSSLPYLAILMNCLLRCVYSLPIVRPDIILVLTISAIGVLVETSFIIIFLICSSRKQRRVTFVMFVLELVGTAGIATFVLLGLHSHQGRTRVVGSICIISNTLIYAAPLSVMKMVIQTRSVEYMPFCLSLASLANAICWTIYALIRLDLSIVIPSGLGILLAVVQLVLYAAFYKSTQPQRGATALERKE